MSVLVACPKNQPTKLLLKPVSGDIIATELQFVELLLWLHFFNPGSCPLLGSSPAVLQLNWKSKNQLKCCTNTGELKPVLLNFHLRENHIIFFFFLSYIWLVKSAVVAIVEWPIVSPPSQPRNYFFMSPSQTNKSAQWIGGILRPELTRLKTCSPETKKGKYQ